MLSGRPRRQACLLAVLVMTDQLVFLLSTPLMYLDSMRDSHLATINFHLGRVERMVLFIFDLTVSPRKTSLLQPPVEDMLTVARLKRASKQVNGFLRSALAALSQICHDIRNVYCDADKEIKRLLSECKSITSPTAAQPKEAVKRSQSARKSAKSKKRSFTASSHPASSNAVEALIDHFPAPQRDFQQATIKSYASDFEESVNRSLVSGKLSNVTSSSIPEDIRDMLQAGSDEELGQVEAEEEGNLTSYAEDFTKPASLVLELKPLLTDAKDKPKKHQKKRAVLPSSAMLQEELDVLMMTDNKLNRQVLLHELLPRPSSAQPPRHDSQPSSAKPISKVHATLVRQLSEGSRYSTDFELADGDDQDSEAMFFPAAHSRCFHCDEMFQGQGKTMPRLGCDDGSWQKAQEHVSQSAALFPNYVNKVTLGMEDVFDLSKTFLAKLQQSAHRVSEGTPIFCSWRCVKRWALGGCPLQYRYQTEILINTAAGHIVE
jgi:hypothetical protein